MGSTALLVDGKPHDGPCDETVWVPPEVAKCPECAGRLLLQVTEWSPDTGRPTDGGVEVECEREPDPEDPDFWDKTHRFWQEEWIPVIDRATAWARRHVRVKGKA